MAARTCWRPSWVWPIPEGASEPGREESFTAWTRFLVAEAALAPLVLVVEDLQWADRNDARLPGSAGRPRPQRPDPRARQPRAPSCSTRTPEWGGGKTNASTITLSPMPEQEMRYAETHSAELLVRSVLPTATQGAPESDARVGNPLYALEFVRMLVDRSP